MTIKKFRRVDRHNAPQRAYTVEDVERAIDTAIHDDCTFDGVLDNETQFGFYTLTTLCGGVSTSNERAINPNKPYEVEYDAAQGEIVGIVVRIESYDTGKYHAEKYSGGDAPTYEYGDIDASKLVLHHIAKINQRLDALEKPKRAPRKKKTTKASEGASQ